LIELIIVVFVVLFCAAITYGKEPSSGRVTVTKPSSKRVDGFGGARAYDYSYVPTYTRGPFPVGLRLERKKTETWREAERVHEEQ